MLQPHLLCLCWLPDCSVSSLKSVFVIVFILGLCIVSLYCVFVLGLCIGSCIVSLYFVFLLYWTLVV
jgi:hypothetical protein